MTTVYRGDFGYDLDFAITDSDGVAYDLSSVTSIKFKMVKANSTTLKVDGNVDIDNAVGGLCSYTVASDDFDTAGSYVAELELTTSTTSIVTIGGISIDVVKDLPRCV